MKSIDVGFGIAIGVILCSVFFFLFGGSITAPPSAYEVVRLKLETKRKEYELLQLEAQIQEFDKLLKNPPSPKPGSPAGSTEGS